MSVMFSARTSLSVIASLKSPSEIPDSICNTTLSACFFAPLMRLSIELFVGVELILYSCFLWRV